ncbi:unnamed protein product [Umbelopsis vinacea]
MKGLVTPVHLDQCLAIEVDHPIDLTLDHQNDATDLPITTLRGIPIAVPAQGLDRRAHAHHLHVETIHNDDRGLETDKGGLLRPEKEGLEEDLKKVNFGLSGKLAAETNTYKGVEVKYNEPPEARTPSKKWRLYVFKGDKQIDLLHIHRQSAFMFGRDRVVADIPVDHPSCSKQHAVLQFRYVNETNEANGQVRRVVKPFIIDLESTNGTHLNGDRIPDSRYIELKVRDVLKFGNSTREYVLLNEEATKG